MVGSLVIIGVRVMVYCITQPSKIFQLYSGRQINRWRKQEKSANFLCLTDKLYLIMLYKVYLAMGGCCNCIG